jgi:immune inhibitor A
VNKLHKVSPSPEATERLYREFVDSGKPLDLTFHQFLEVNGFANHSEHVHGMDDGIRVGAAGEGPDLIRVPPVKVQGSLKVLVLLVDFSDQEGTRPISYYEKLLFSKSLSGTGSMRDYYREVSLNKVNVSGSVHGWFRMPRPYSYYHNNESGTGEHSYPRNSQRMAEHAVQAAVDAGVNFDPKLDLSGDGGINALFIVHAGYGAEKFDLRDKRKLENIWSHKWVLREPINVGNNLKATTYLTVPQAASVGLCAHELGHLAFQWEDFYDPNYGRDGKAWDGSGVWDLMAGGSWNGGGSSPAHPAALHKIQHDWVELELVKTSSHLTLEPYTPTSGKVIKIVSKKYSPSQYLLLENRTKQGFDSQLPGEGLLVWRVDENKQQFAPEKPALYLIQADGRHELARVGDLNAGDRGDPFPGDSGITYLNDSGHISTTFPDGDDSGVFLKNITRDPVSGVIDLEVEIEGTEGNQQEIVFKEAEPKKAIPDADENGTTNSIRIGKEGGVQKIAVFVDIEHSYIGDLSVVLVSPTGQKAILHNNSGGPANNLKKIYHSSQLDSLAKMIDAPVKGDWTLSVVDSVANDVGILKKWGLEISITHDSPTIKHKKEINLPIPDNNPTGISSAVKVSRRGIVRSIKVFVEIDHEAKGDLRVELVHPTGEVSILHNKEGEKNKNLKKTFESEYHESLSRFIGKAARGEWVLRVSDLTGQDTGTLKSWALEIEMSPKLKPFVERTLNPELPIPDNDKSGIGHSVKIGDSGTLQSMEVFVDITHTFTGDLRVELVAPSGKLVIIQRETGVRGKDLHLKLDSNTSEILKPLLGQPTQGVWVLRVIDLAGIDTGTLNTWGLKLYYI